MHQRTIILGLDVHKETIAVARADRGGRGPVWLGEIPNTPQAMARLLRKLGPPEHIAVCYEAGPCGYALYRQLTELGGECTVVASSLVPKAPGNRVTTDRRDATQLAHLHRSGLLTPVWVPDSTHEALRDLVRMREQARQDLQRARQRLSKLLLRMALTPPAKVRSWTKAYEQWLDGLVLAHPAQQMVLGDLVQMAECAKRRVARLDTQITTQLEQSPLASLWWALQSLRGLSTVSASVRVAALGDLSRCAHPRQLMAYAGLTPSEHSSGGRHQRGGITKTGNTAVRRVLGEMAWHYRHQPALGVRLRACQRDQPAAIVAISWQAQTRLHPRFLRLIFRGKLKQQAVVAIARELLGVIWEIATIVRHQSQDQRTALAEPSTADWQVAEPADEQGPGRSVLGPPLAVGANPSPRL